MSSLTEEGGQEEGKSTGELRERNSGFKERKGAGSVAAGGTKRVGFEEREQEAQT